MVAYTENIDTCIRLLLSYGLEAIDAALVVHNYNVNQCSVADHGDDRPAGTLCSTAVIFERLRRSAHWTGRRLSDQSNVTLRDRTTAAARLLRDIVSRPPDFPSSPPHPAR